MNICSLPTELKLHILSFLDTNCVRFVVAKLNQEFNELAQDCTLYRSYKQRSYDKTGELARIDLGCSLYTKYLKQLTIIGSSRKCFGNHQFSSLQELFVVQGELNDYSIEKLGYAAPNLRVLRLERTLDISVLTKHRHLYGVLHPDTKVNINRPADSRLPFLCIYHVRSVQGIRDLEKFLSETTASTAESNIPPRLQIKLYTTSLTQSNVNRHFFDVV